MTHNFCEDCNRVRLSCTGTVELNDPDAPPNWRRADALRRNAERMFATPPGGATTQWMGPRPSLPDSLPVVDRAGPPGVFLNFGHAHWGLSGAPRSAALVADMIAGRDLPAEASLFRARRFAG